MTDPTFQQRLWAVFTAQRPQPDDPALRYGGAGRSEDKLRHFTGTPFYQALLPETQNILRRWSRPSDARTLFGDTRRAEAELVSNTRLQRLQALDQLAVFVDEAHHSFGRSLEGGLKRGDEIEHPNVKAEDAAAREVFEALSGILYCVKPDDEIRRGEIHDIFRHTSSAPVGK